MRLLEFENVNDGNNPQAATLTRKPAHKPADGAAPARRPDAARTPARKVFPASGKYAMQQTLRRQPIDIEQLQQRVQVLERRMRERARAEGSQLPVMELQQLRQRMKLLERSVNNELWAAKQREHTLLEMLARPPLKQLLRDHARRLHTRTLRAARHCHAALDQLHQPSWWPHFVRAWHESLDKARGNHNT